MSHSRHTAFLMCLDDFPAHLEEKSSFASQGSGELGSTDGSCPPSRKARAYYEFQFPSNIGESIVSFFFFCLSGCNNHEV